MTNRTLPSITGLRESITLRPTVPAMENHMRSPIPVLDHGFVRLVDYMGNDESITQAARVSYGSGTKAVQNNEGLIRYLMRHRHSTPFEMCEIKLHVKLPVFVARQWIRHRMANVNEYSARYSILDREFYLPDADVLARQSTTNNQGRDESLTPEQAIQVMDFFRQDAATCYDHYEEMVDPSGIGLARELARINLPAGIYTQWYWKIDLHNLLHFLSLRADSHAQYEIRDYAEAILSIVADWVPITHAAFKEYRLGAFTFSATMMEVLRRMVHHGTAVNQDESGLTKREWREMEEALRLR